MEDIEIPDSYDPEWMQIQLRELAERLEVVELQVTEEEDPSAIEGAIRIVEVLREYAGY